MVANDEIEIREGAGGHLLFSATKAEPHKLTPFAKPEGTRVSYPGVV